MSSPPGFNVYNTDTVDSPASYAFNMKVLAGAIILIFLVIFFILMVHVCAKWCLQGSSSYTISFMSPNATASARINPGLDKAVIAQLPTFVYKGTSPVDNLELDVSVSQPSLECAVCLSEFQENDEGRMLPSCKHTFHTECIDMWFLSHSTCPLCRTKVGPAMATSASTDEQPREGEEQEAMEPSPGTTEGNPVISNVVEYPCNVLFWGNQTQVVSSQQSSSSSSSSSSPLSRSLHMPGARALPQITIDIPPVEGNVPVSTSGPLSAKCTMEQEAGSSQPLKSPGFRASIKRMLSRQSSRHKSSSQEGYEESPK